MSLEAASIRLRGYARLAVGQFAGATEDLTRAAELFQAKVPDSWQRVLSRLWLSATYFRSGRLSHSAEIASDVFWIAVSARQDRVGQMAIDTWARATDGNLPFPELARHVRPAPDDHTTTVQFKLAECLWLLKQGKTLDATRVAAEAVDIIRLKWALNLWTVPAFSMLARALREHALFLKPSSNGTAVEYLSRSIRAARQAVRYARLLRIDYPTTLREYCLSAAATGRKSKALRLARRSCEISAKQGATYEYAKSLLVCGQLGESLGKPDARQQIEEAEQQLAEFDRQIEEANQMATEYLRLNQSEAS